ncbi:sialate O-acetylesterase [Leeuwenhoekiella marinoflava]|uniref:Sialate O-acetylesterase n=2 Tax=Leeuwenhoekiella marinoflava TaxID=988 RepID=A0A4Q0PPG3_9FLAO|nr:sialate O-acetylesterase [Leeuwenhoekiella marinoflava]RXG32373.1 sialate O-acetylesterase [Leeuwenhoekiella marinoflava]SHE74139.1 sialate O-acetylesterase [Leeuwenhoekiella marinoflava DSM 3653]
MKTAQLLSIICTFLIVNPALQAQLKLPRLISDGMVLQRNVEVPVWGWTEANAAVTVSFNDKEYNTQASADGSWQVKLTAMKAGGPYEMRVAGRDTLIVKDILVGDVWLCTGQSNMVHQLDIHDVRYAEEIATANNSEIRHFKVPISTSISGPLQDLSGGVWQQAVGQEVRPFSAVASFFAKKIYERYKIPIGLINASVGGTPIEAWIPKEAYKDFPEILAIIEENKDTTLVNSQQNSGLQNSEQKEVKDKGLSGKLAWYDVNFKPKDWRRINIPGYWEDQGIKDLNGVVWYRKELELPKSMANQEARVFLGRIVDADQLYINGQLVGETTYQYPQRRYQVPENLLKEGKNSFTVRVTNSRGKGGFVPDKPYYLFTDKDTVDLKGYWQYKVGEVFKPFDYGALENNATEEPQKRRINPQNEPAALYNAMVAPYKNYSLKGILWYQGESNTGNPQIYDDYMIALISGLRSVFNNPELPFVFAQLPNFMEVSYLPSESNWAALREAQLKASSVSNTAMTVNIDLGEWNDIHPDNKKDVGERMALAGLKIAYNEDIVFSGPLYDHHKIEGDRVIITFKNAGSGLITNDGEELSEFAIAGKNKKFVWANARIEGNKVIVWSDQIKDPVYVRYAWADNPDNPNLYNEEGLPASPFRIE